jgi:hypothetical protein
LQTYLSIVFIDSPNTVLWGRMPPKPRLSPKPKCGKNMPAKSKGVTKTAKKAADAGKNKADTEKNKADAEKKEADAAKNKDDAAKNKDDTEKNKADVEKNKADVEKNKADAEKNKADAEKNKADAEKNEANRIERWFKKTDAEKNKADAENKKAEKTDNPKAEAVQYTQAEIIAFKKTIKQQQQTIEAQANTIEYGQEDITAFQKLDVRALFAQMKDLNTHEEFIKIACLWPFEFRKALEGTNIDPETGFPPVNLYLIQEEITIALAMRDHRDGKMPRVLTKKKLEELVNKKPSFFEDAKDKVKKDDVAFVPCYVKNEEEYILCRGKQLLPEKFIIDAKNEATIYWNNLPESSKVAVVCGVDGTVVCKDVKDVRFLKTEEIFKALKALPEGEQWNGDSASQVAAEGGGASTGEGGGASTGEGGGASTAIHPDTIIPDSEDEAEAGEEAKGEGGRG